MLNDNNREKKKKKEQIGVSGSKPQFEYCSLHSYTTTLQLIGLLEPVVLVAHDIVSI